MAKHEDLVHAIPGIRVLRLPSLCLRPSDLLCYAANLRDLEVFSIALDFDPGFVVDKTSHVPVTHEVLLEDLNLPVIELHICQVARQLYGLWPGVRCIITKKRIQLPRSNPVLCDQLNKAIARCRDARV
ncbi:hypothetical protein FRC08_017329 [Ceratobasidium sp. 394]|nr:hypothetical protein FRC08_017329 [Ceratobasidium sp. 394]